MRIPQKIIKLFRGSRGAQRIIFECNQCQKHFDRSGNDIKRKWGKFCSKDCSNEYRKSWVGKKAIGWKGGLNKHSQGYILEYAPEHPRAQSGKYVYQHILVIEKHIGRFTTEKEQVHHLNGVKNDNRIENLQLCKNSEEHTRYENGWWRIKDTWFKKCTICLQEKEVSFDNFYRRSMGKWLPSCKSCTKIEINERNATIRRGRQHERSNGNLSLL